jgi:hypothetical protein
MVCRGRRSGGATREGVTDSAAAPDEYDVVRVSG